MKRIIIFSFICIAIISKSFAQNVIISGNAKTYAGDTLTLYTFSDYIVKNKEVLKKAKVDSSGNFIFNLNISETICSYIDLNVFRGVIYIEPGKEYKIILPEKTLKNDEDKLNPYFRMQDFYIRALNTDKNDLNNAIIKFDALNNYYIDRLFANYKGKVHSKVAEDAIKAITDSMSYISNPFFENYKKYEFALLRFTTYLRKKEQVLNMYFKNDEILYRNPSYNLALSKIFSDYLSEYISSNLNKKQSNKSFWNKLNNDIINATGIENEDFREYLIISNLYNLFYTKPELKKNLLEKIKIVEDNLKIDFHKKIISDFLFKAKKLIPGNIAPYINLKNSKNEIVSLEKFRGKFVYLGFYCPDSYPCKKDIDLLKNLRERNIDLLEIVTIWKDKSYKDMIEYVKSNDIKHTFLFCKENSPLLKEYKIHTFPTYFFIHPEGKLLMISAPSPSEDFEATYYKIYQDWRRKLIRNKRDNKGKSIIINN